MNITELNASIKCANNRSNEKAIRVKPFNELMTKPQLMISNPNAIEIESEFVDDNLVKEYGNCYNPETRVLQQVPNGENSRSSTSSTKFFSDADIAQFNEWAEADGAVQNSTVKKIVREDNNVLRFILRHPLHWSKVKAKPRSGSAQVFDAIFEGPNGIAREDKRYLRSIKIRIDSSSNGYHELEKQPFSAYAFSDEEGSRVLAHPNVDGGSQGRICMGDLNGSTLLGKLHIHDICTLMTNINMTSAYGNARGMKTNSGESFTLTDSSSSLYEDREKFKPHSYFGDK